MKGKSCCCVVTVYLLCCTKTFVVVFFFRCCCRVVVLVKSLHLDMFRYIPSKFFPVEQFTGHADWAVDAKGKQLQGDLLTAAMAFASREPNQVINLNQYGDAWALALGKSRLTRTNAQNINDIPLFFSITVKQSEDGGKTCSEDAKTILVIKATLAECAIESAEGFTMLEELKYRLAAKIIGEPVRKRRGVPKPVDVDKKLGEVEKEIDKNHLTQEGSDVTRELVRGHIQSARDAVRQLMQHPSGPPESLVQR